MVVEKLEKLGTREKVFLVVGLVAFLAALGNPLVVRPAVARLHELHSAIEIEKEQVAYHRAVVESHSPVEQVYEQVDELFAETTTTASDNDLMMGQIDDLALRSDLEILEIQPRDPRLLPSPQRLYYREHIVDLAFQGTMQNLLTFLHTMQKSGIPGLLAVDQLSIGVGRQEGTIKGNMTISKVAVDG